MRPLTRSCFLLLVLGRLFLLALPFLLGISLRSRWSPPFPLHALALTSFFLAKMRLSPILTLSPLMIWCFGQTALFLFLLAGAAPAFLPTALSVALRPLFPFRQPQYAQVFPLKPAPFCTLFAGLGSTNKSAIPFLFSSIFPLISNSVADLAGTVLSLLFYLTTMGPRTLVSPGERYLRPPQPLVVSLLLSQTGGVLSHQSSLTHRFPRFPPRNLCSLVMLVVSSLVFAATDTAFS